MAYNQSIAENSSYGSGDYANYANTTDHKDFANWEYPAKLSFGAKWDKSQTENTAGQGDQPSDGLAVSRPMVTPKVKGGLIDADVLNELRAAANAVKSQFSNKTTDATIPAAVEQSKILTDQVVTDDTGTPTTSGNGILDALVDMGKTVTGPPKNSIITEDSINNAAKELMILAKYANYANYSRVGSAPTYANGYYANYSRYNKDYSYTNYTRTVVSVAAVTVAYGKYRACCYCGGIQSRHGYVRHDYGRYYIGCNNRTGVEYRTQNAESYTPAYTYNSPNYYRTTYARYAQAYANVNGAAYTKSYANTVVDYANAVYADAPD